MHQNTLHRTLRGGAAVLGVALAVAAAGCGVTGSAESVSRGPAAGSGEAGTATTGGVRFLSSAVDTTGEVTTEKATITMELGGAGGDRTASVTTEGAFDLAAGRAEVTFDLGGAGGAGSILGDSPATLIVDGSTIYATGSVFEMLTEEGKPWIKVDGKGAAGLTEEFTDGLASDPQAYVEMLRGAGDEFVEVGQEDVRGVPTTHVTTTIDLTELADDASPKDRERIDDALAKLGADADVVTEVPADVWIDDDGYVRRLRLAPDVGGVAGKDIAGVITIELYDFDVPVDITIPSADQISELGDLLGGN